MVYPSDPPFIIEKPDVMPKTCTEMRKDKD